MEGRWRGTDDIRHAVSSWLAVQSRGTSKAPSGPEALVTQVPGALAWPVATINPGKHSQEGSSRAVQIPISVSSRAG
jgi:hypothetical protein